MRFPIIIVVPKLKVNAIALFPFILVRHISLKYDTVTIRHEKIHLWQEVELLIIPFYIVYLSNYLINLVKYKNHDKAYRRIIFEQEAYKNESDAQYLSKRRFWAWLKFIK